MILPYNNTLIYIMRNWLVQLWRLSGPSSPAGEAENQEYQLCVSSTLSLRSKAKYQGPKSEAVREAGRWGSSAISGTLRWSLLAERAFSGGCSKSGFVCYSKVCSKTASMALFMSSLGEDTDGWLESTEKVILPIWLLKSEDQTQGLVPRRQECYHWATSSASSPNIFDTNFPSLVLLSP